ncbi:acyl-CoA dehydrogenase family protein [Streptomyces sp. NPDC050560]|uniref:acyl-CoA dehydrogenase family protein n=1 Tax=Streptomyces sp. NPDC050560 TaxID=3365630 RepID=UPI00379D6805
MSTAPDLLYSDEEEALRSAVRGLLGDHGGPSRVLAHAEDGRPYDRDLWAALAEGMDLAGLLVPERLGGQGATHREAAVALEELGRSLAPVPFLTSAVIATETLLSCLCCPDTPATGPGHSSGGPDSTAEELLRTLAAGATVAVLAVPFTAGPGSPPATTVEERGGRLHGRVTSVAGAHAADHLLVPTRTGLWAVDAAAATLTPRTSLDVTRPLADVALDAAPARLVAPHTPAADTPGDAATSPAAAALDRGLSAGAGLLASEQLGLAEWCLAETVRHTRERHQFNRPLGSFQALKHRLAHVWLDTVHSRAAARNAADALATATAAPDDETALAVALAKSHCSATAVHAAEEALQLHGGTGMTWEHPLHLYLKRARADTLALGSADRHLDRLAALTGLTMP